MHLVPWSLWLPPWVYLLTASLWGPGKLAFLIPQHCNSWFPRKELIPLSRALTFAFAARGHLYNAWLWRPVGLMPTDHIGL